MTLEELHAADALEAATAAAGWRTFQLEHYGYRAAEDLRAGVDWLYLPELDHNEHPAEHQRRYGRLIDIAGACQGSAYPRLSLLLELPNGRTVVRTVSTYRMLNTYAGRRTR